MGGKETLNDAEWLSGAASYSGSIRCIPPRTATGMARGVSRPEYDIRQTRRGYKKPGSEKAEPKQKRRAKPAILDFFEEKNHCLVIGEFPGIDDKNLVVEIRNEKLIVITKPNAKRKYFAELGLPEKSFAIKERKFENHILKLKLSKPRKRKK